jgi:hypothetical protein
MESATGTSISRSDEDLEGACADMLARTPRSVRPSSRDAAATARGAVRVGRDNTAARRWCFSLPSARAIG